MYCKSFLLKVLYKTLFSECFCQKNVTNQKYEEKSDSCVADGGRGGEGDRVSVRAYVVKVVELRQLLPSRNRVGVSVGVFCPTQGLTPGQ